MQALIRDGPSGKAVGAGEGGNPHHRPWVIEPFYVIVVEVVQVIMTAGRGRLASGRLAEWHRSGIDDMEDDGKGLALSDAAGRVKDKSKVEFKMQVLHISLDVVGPDEVSYGRHTHPGKGSFCDL